MDEVKEKYSVDIPDAVSLLSTSAFKLLVGAIRCGNRGEPLTRSRSVGC